LNANEESSSEEKGHEEKEVRPEGRKKPREMRGFFCDVKPDRPRPPALPILQ
jgi:hypothetical protein